ncbi:hypothetical protein GTP41_05220 [Pseudoduganella sp. DS3]|uniref:Uncharacterized protein n=1 Tax=Pseudoduganella guangdongensis TaxID=2692179 RepID=A0A6N9HDA3_9BURK|nr:hypothetical protein [Pseudoduganella guangdongensis]MYN01494.1 hypothetical protein [Pseudoduganella guangdongensis]
MFELTQQQLAYVSGGEDIPQVDVPGQRPDYYDDTYVGGKRGEKLDFRDTSSDNY